MEELPLRSDTVRRGVARLSFDALFLLACTQERGVAGLPRQGPQRPADDLSRFDRQGLRISDCRLERRQVCADLWRRGESDFRLSSRRFGQIPVIGSV
jgi:hypothetical protein